MCRDRLLLSLSLSLSVSLSVSLFMSLSVSLSLSFSLSLSLSVCLSLSLSITLYKLSLSFSTDSLQLSLPFVPFIFPVTQNAPELGIFQRRDPKTLFFPGGTHRKNRSAKMEVRSVPTFFAIFTYFSLFFSIFRQKGGQITRALPYLYIVSLVVMLSNWVCDTRVYRFPISHIMDVFALLCIVRSLLFAQSYECGCFHGCTRESSKRLHQRKKPKEGPITRVSLLSQVNLLARTHTHSHTHTHLTAASSDTGVNQ